MPPELGWLRIMSGLEVMPPAEAVRCARVIAEAAWPVAWRELPKRLASLGWVPENEEGSVFHTSAEHGMTDGLATQALPGELGSVMFLLNRRLDFTVGAPGEAQVAQELEELRGAVLAELLQVWGPPVEDDEAGQIRESKWVLANGAEVVLSRLKRLCAITVRSPQDIEFVRLEEQSL